MTAVVEGISGLLDCPQGFEIPDDPTSYHNVYINRTISECAISCMHPPLFTPGEATTMGVIKECSYIITAVLTCTALFLWLMDKKKREQVFVVTYGAVVSVGFAVMAIFNSFGQKRLCLSNTVPIDADDAQSDVFSICMLEAALFCYVAYFCSFCYAIQSMELFRVIVLKLGAPTLTIKYWYMTLILVLPLITAIGCLFVNVYGPDTVIGTCSYVNNNTIGSALFVIPLIFFIAAGLFFSVAITVKLLVLIWTPNARGGISTAHGVAMAGTSLKFILFFGCYLLSLLYIRITLANVEGYESRAIKWGVCALQYFDGTVSSYAHHCGEHVPRRVPFTTTCFLMVWVFAGFGCFFIVVNLEGLVALLKRRLFGVAIEPIRDYEYEPASASSSQMTLGSQGEAVLAGLYEQRVRVKSYMPRVPDFVGGRSMSRGDSVLTPASFSRQASQSLNMFDRLDSISNSPMSSPMGVLGTGGFSRANSAAGIAMTSVGAAATVDGTDTGTTTAIATFGDRSHNIQSNSHYVDSRSFSRIHDDTV